MEFDNNKSMFLQIADTISERVVNGAYLLGAMQLRFTGVKKSTYSEVPSTVYLMEFRYLVIRNSVNLSLMPAKETRWLSASAKMRRIQEFHTGRKVTR